MKIVKYSLFFLFFSGFSYCDQIFDQITNNIKTDMGKNFNKEYSDFKSTPSYGEMMNLINKESISLSLNKKQFTAPRFDNIFYGLKAISGKSSSILPNLYAYHYMEWSYGNKNRNFNREYGYFFANKLASKGVCQGYLWMARLGETDAGLYKESLDNYTRAIKVCAGRYKMQALHGHALMRYFATRKVKNKK